MIKLKGMHDSMIRCVIPEDLDVSEIAKSLREVASEGHGVLPGCRVVLDFGGRPMTHDVIRSVLSDLVWPSGIEIAAWVTRDTASQVALKRVGLPTAEPTPPSKEDAGKRVGLVVQSSLRSGQRVDHDGDVIVIGHVNGGAEVFAAGNIVVLGRLSGLVHAGYGGYDGATVAARSLETPQIRIGSRFGSLDKNAEWWGKSIIARVDDDIVLIEYWPVLKAEGKA